MSKIFLKTRAFEDRVKGHSKAPTAEDFKDKDISEVVLKKKVKDASRTQKNTYF